MVAKHTNGKVKTKPESHALLVEIAQALSEPLDIDELVAEGVLTKRRGGWYEVSDPERLPGCARCKIKSVKSGNRVKFRKPSKRARSFLQSIEAAT